MYIITSSYVNIFFGFFHFSLLWIRSFNRKNCNCSTEKYIEIDVFKTHYVFLAIHDNNYRSLSCYFVIYCQDAKTYIEFYINSISIAYPSVELDLSRLENLNRSLYSLKNTFQTFAFLFTIVIYQFASTNTQNYYLIFVS